MPLSWSFWFGFIGVVSMDSAALDREPPPTAPLGVCFDEPGAGALYAVGTDWKARFARDGTSFVPFLGSDAPKNFPVTLRVTELRLAGQVLEFDREAEPTLRRSSVHYLRGAFEERYDARPDGLEQSFVIEDLVQRGEILVTCALESDLAARELGGIVELAGPHGGVRISQALVRDSSGRQLALECRLRDAALELRVPEAFVLAAELPLVIDPLFQTFSITSGGPDEIAPDVVTRSTPFGGGQTWRLDVWEVVWSTSDHDVKARRFDEPSGQVVDFVVDATSEFWSGPKAAQITSTKIGAAFGVVAQVGPPGSTSHEIRGRALYSYSSMPGPVQTISTPPTDDHRSPDIGADTFTTPATVGFLVVWEVARSSGEIDVVGRRVGNLSGSPGLPLIDFGTEPGVEETRPAISKSNAAQEWGVVWERRVGTNNRDLWARRMGWGDAAPGPAFPIATALEDESRPAISSRQAAGPPRYVVACEVDVGGRRDVALQVVEGSAVLERAFLAPLETGAQAVLDRTSPAVDGQETGYVVAYREHDPASGDAQARITTFDVTGGGGIVLHETRLPLGSARSGGNLEVCARGANAGTGGRHDIAWSEPGAAHDLDVFGASFLDGPSSGAIAAICYGNASLGPCPCTSNGGEPAGCPNSIAAAGADLLWTGQASVDIDTLAVLASRLPPAAPAVLLQGSTVLHPPVSFGDGLSCLGGAQTRIATRMATAAGAFSFPETGDPPISIAGHLPMGGGLRVYQLVYRDGAPFCTPQGWNATNALRVAWSR